MDRKKNCRLEQKIPSGSSDHGGGGASAPPPRQPLINPYRPPNIKRSGLFALSLLFLAASILMLSNEYLLEGAYEKMGDLNDEDLTRAALAHDVSVSAIRPPPAAANNPIQKQAGIRPNEPPLQSLIPPPTNQYHIFQASIGMSGSTLLSNILIGLFEGTEPNYAFMEQDFKTHCGGNLDAPINSTVVTKTHYIDLDEIVSRYHEQFDRIFFVSSNRGPHKIDDKYCGKDGLYSVFVLCLDYDEFTYKSPDKMADAVSFVRRKLVEQFPYFAQINFDEGATIERLKEMAEVMDKMKNEPFGSMDQKFGIHGSHKGRFAKKFGAEQQKEQKKQNVVVAGTNNIVVKPGGKLAGSLRRKEDMHL